MTIRLARVYDSATAICAKTLIIYISVNAQLQVLSGRRIWYCSPSLISRAIKHVPASKPAPLSCLLLSPPPYTASFNLPELESSRLSNEFFDLRRALTLQCEFLK